MPVRFTAFWLALNWSPQRGIRILQTTPGVTSQSQGASFHFPPISQYMATQSSRPPVSLGSPEFHALYSTGVPSTHLKLPSDVRWRPIHAPQNGNPAVFFTRLKINWFSWEDLMMAISPPICLHLFRASLIFRVRVLST